MTSFLKKRETQKVVSRIWTFWGPCKRKNKWERAFDIPGLDSFKLHNFCNMQALLRILPFRGFLLECTLIKTKQLTRLSVMLEEALWPPTPKCQPNKTDGDRNTPDPHLCSLKTAKIRCHIPKVMYPVWLLVATQKGVSYGKYALYHWSLASFLSLKLVCTSTVFTL